MLILVAILAFAVAVLEHAGVFTAHDGWLNWQGLMLLGLLFWCASGFSPSGFSAPGWWRRRGE